jgi:phosphoribosylformylglycinamidine synthase
VTLTGDPGTLLFSESAARAVVAVQPGAEAEFARRCELAGAPAAVIGATGGTALEVTGRFRVGLDELAAAHRAALPALFG